MSLPGLRGAHHVGLTVPDLEEAERFLCGVLGARLVLDGGTIEDPDILVRVLGAGPRDRCRYRLYRLGTGLNLEVFAYEGGAAGPHPSNARPGGHHVALYVDDVAAAAAHLEAHGIETAGAPERIEEGPAAGAEWLYFRAPWGLQMELVSGPWGRTRERGAVVGLWSPLRPGE